jgi:2,3,4,5-tetrahydropyridine-2-carboxylate N-succinyltransferase
MKTICKGISNHSQKGEVLDMHFSSIKFNGKEIENNLFKLNNDNQKLFEISFNEDTLNDPIKDIRDAYLKLHLLSHKFVLPNTINLEGLFTILPNIVWTNQGPIALEEIDARLNESKFHGNNLYIRSIDKFPCFTDYVIPKKVRIADSSRVRLGAYLGEGTTIMHEGFVNFNAGTLGKAMIEGRISSGVVVGNNSDLGGGSSTMGTLSGGNDVKISIGENCLLGANSGIGISLGDNCTVEAGLYITAGTKVTINENNNTKLVKASNLSGLSNLLFYRDSTNGMVVAKDNIKVSELNEALHKND